MGLAPDLRHRMGPFAPMLALLDPKLPKNGRVISQSQLDDLSAFLLEGLLDPRALPQNLCHLVPASVPSGEPVLAFEGCPPPQP
jgi:hypothetical protein